MANFQTRHEATAHQEELRLRPCSPDAWESVFPRRATYAPRRSRAFPPNPRQDSIKPQQSTPEQTNRGAKSLSLKSILHKALHAKALAQISRDPYLKPLTINSSIFTST